MAFSKGILFVLTKAGKTRQLCKICKCLQPKYTNVENAQPNFVVCSNCHFNITLLPDAYARYARVLRKYILVAKVLCYAIFRGTIIQRGII